MKPDLLNYIDDVVNERLTLLHERESDPTWINENEDLKASTEEEIKKCNDVLRQIEIELFDNYLSSLKSHTIVLDKKYKNKEEFIEDYKNNEYFYDRDSYHNGEYINKKEIEYNKTDIIRFFDDNLGCLIFDCKKLEFIDDIRNK